MPSSALASDAFADPVDEALATARASLVADVAAARQQHRLPLTLRRDAEAWGRDALAFLFPHFATACPTDARTLEAAFDSLHARLRRLVVAEAALGDHAPCDAPDAVLADLPDLRRALLDDARATCDADPAARSVDEVILAYPGFLATALHRIAHALYGRGALLLARLLAELAHRETGIDLHPGARIGPRFSIDHGTGVVVGETAQIGADVRLYQGVTLGALAVEKGLAGIKRHPTLEGGVVVYANATILGGDTVVGAGSVIGGNVWLTRSVPPGSVVTRSAAVRPLDAPASTPSVDIHDWVI